jgi:hyperosmotically inducible protein
VTVAADLIPEEVNIMRSRLAAVVAIVAIVAMSSAPAFADPQSDTLQIFKEIQKRIDDYAYFTIFDNVHVGIDETGVATLTGSVTNPFKKNRIQDRVEDVAGIVSVDNQIESLPVSRFDDRLRYQVARAVYGHPSMRQYIRTHPSIHIVVKRGHVTLTGVVNNESDETIALLEAGHVGAFSVTSELKTSEEVEAELELL